MMRIISSKQTATRLVYICCLVFGLHIFYAVLINPVVRTTRYWSEIVVFRDGDQQHVRMLEDVDGDGMSLPDFPSNRRPPSSPPQRPFYNRRHTFDCPAIFNGDQWESINATQTRRPLRTEYEMAKIFADCSVLRQRYYYPDAPYSQSEATFPLAYVILLNEHLEQIESLFNAIYAPQNYYCFHVDFKAPFLFHYAVRKLARCFPDQVFVSDRGPLPISRESSHTLHAITQCFEKLTNVDQQRQERTPWKYAMTIQGHDFPLRTNREMVEILRLHRGMNDFELTPGQKERYDHAYQPYLDPLGQPAGMNYWSNRSAVDPLPDDRLTIYKGNMAGAFSRPFVEFLLADNISKSYLNWLDKAFMPDEHYFSTINHNEFLNAPGGYPGDCVDRAASSGENRMKPWISRFSVWMWYADDYDIGGVQKVNRSIRCRGTYRNSVCVFSTLDLPMLIGRPELFLNKFWLERDPVAVDCMHERLYNRSLEQRAATMANSDEWTLPRYEYYNGLAAVRFGEWRRANPTRNSSEFECVRCKNCEH